MPITVSKHEAYGPPLVNEKYAPLENPAYVEEDQPVYSWMLTNRARALRSARRLGQPLTLATPGWAGAGGGANIVAAEAGHLPPLVVISSNRSKWIRAGLDAATAQLTALGEVAFTNASDLRALTALVGQEVSPPIYAPSRVGPNRNVYVVVHMMEYRTYKQALDGTGITPVGWEFDRGGGGVRGLQLVGFGASRFAAMEFCKTLRRAAALAAGGAAPWDYAWLVDDNVVALTNFAGFAAVEGAMGPAVACAGLGGGTDVIPKSKNMEWATAEVNAGRGGQAGALPADLHVGIVQQMSLWNVAYLDANHLNFGPIFVASAEDLSITNYFQAQGITYRFYKGIGVRKEVTTYDNGGPARKVNTAREGLAAWVTAAESGPTPPGGAPPPPVQVKPRAEDDDGGVQALSDFVVNKVLPKSRLKDQATNVSVQNTARCQAVEQLTSGAIKAGFVTPAANTAAFSINGAAQQVVNRVDLP